MTLSAGTCLLTPVELLFDENIVGMISPEVQLTLELIAQFTVTVRRRKLCLSKSTTFDEFLDYHTSNRKPNQRKYDTAAFGQEHTPAGFDQKVPTFLVPKFAGDSL